MTDITKSEAQHRIDQIKAFQDELAQLRDDKVLQLSDVQRQAVDAYHDKLQEDFVRDFDVDRDQRAKQLSRGMMIASFLGALALAASIFFLFYQFWGYFTTPVQVVILVLAPLLTFYITVVVSHKEKTGYFAKLAAMVSFACFILNLSMLGRIFNITPTENALLVWAAYGFLLAYMCDARLLLAAGIISLIGFISARTGTWSGMYWIHFGERPENFFPAAIILFLLPQLISAFPRQRKPGCSRAVCNPSTAGAGQVGRTLTREGALVQIRSSPCTSRTIDRRARRGGCSAPPGCCNR